MPPTILDQVEAAVDNYDRLHATGGYPASPQIEPMRAMARILRASKDHPLTSAQRSDFTDAFDQVKRVVAVSTVTDPGTIGFIAAAKSFDDGTLGPEEALAAAFRLGAGPARGRTRLSNDHPDDRAYPGRKSLHAESWGDRVLAESERVTGTKALLANGSIAVSVPLNPEPVASARMLRFLRELIPGVATPGTNFSYLAQTTRTNNAAPVAEAGKKPTSVYTLTRVDAITTTIAHLTEGIPRQQLDDAEILRQFIDDELRYGLDLAVDAQILSGNGTPPNLRGILNTVGIQTVAAGTDALVRARAALTTLQLADLEATGYVFNPTDWSKVETLALATYAANPNTPAVTDLMARRLFGVPVLVSNAITAGTALLGAFASSCYLAVTQEARIDWSENGYDPDAYGAGLGGGDFERNLIRFRAEARYGLAVTRPTGFVKITIA